jgi:cytochrome P450
VPSRTFLCYAASHLTTQGPDADDFNPDRFIDRSGDISALADTKDGMLFARP